MKYPCIESTIDFTFIGLHVRLWINQEEIPEDFLSERETIEKIRKLDHVNKKKLIENIIKLVPNLNVVQVRDKEYGVVVYTVPFNDIKG